MRILVYVHASPPRHWAGAETMFWEMAQQMKKRGHEVKVMAKDAEEQIYEGIELAPTPDFKETGRKLSIKEKWFSWADVVWTHLGYAGDAVNFANRYKKPVLHIVHNSAKIGSIARPTPNQGLIFNSEWLCDLHKGYNIWDYPRPYTVCRPTIDPSKYKVEPTGTHLTLINVNQNKGGWEFYQLAEMNKDWNFLGVQGMYGHQVFRDGVVMTEYIGGVGGVRGFEGDVNCEYTKVDWPSNLTYRPNGGNMKEVYSMTKILLIMSHYESWGRTASEAMCSGIPVIYSATQGLKEHVADGGLMIQNRDNLEEWEEAIKTVMNNYEEYSRRALARYNAIGNDYDNLEQLCIYVSRWSPRTRTVRI